MNPKDIYVLVGCEESQEITKAFRALDIKAFSCDLKPCSGGHPEWHIQGDIFEAINGHTNGLPNVGWLRMQNGAHEFIPQWNAAIFHPECTYLTVSGLHWNGRVPGRAEKTEEALQFVCDLMNCGIENIAIENPVGCICTRIFENTNGVYEVAPNKIAGIKPDQIIQPYQFGEDASKATCLWLQGFPKLKETDYFPPRIVEGKKRWGNQTDSGQNKLGPSDKRKELRSKTYLGIARGIASQWSQYLINKEI